MVYATKHVLPIMREQNAGAIVNISSMAAWSNYPGRLQNDEVGGIALTEQTAARNARYNIRADVILPGLMDTPMAVDTRAQEWNKPREEIAAERDAKVPLGRKMGTGWDVAYAALFWRPREQSSYRRGAQCRWRRKRGLSTSRVPAPRRN